MNDKVIRVLLLEDNAGDARLMGELLKESTTTQFDLVHVERLTDALIKLTKETFDVVIIDLTVPDSSGFETFLKIRSLSEDLPIIVLTGFSEDELAEKTLQEGAQDYLVKGQVSNSSLQRAIKFAIERQKKKLSETPAPTSKKTTQPSAPEKKGKILGFIGAKGGVGTSTVVINIGIILAKERHRITTVELMPHYGSFSQLLGHMPGDNLKSLLDYDLKSIDEGLLNHKLFKHPTGLKVLFSPQSSHEIQEIDPEHAKAIINCLKDIADYTLIDFPNYPSNTTKESILKCDSLTLVSDAEPVSLASGKVMLDLISSWGFNRSHINAIIVNRVISPQPVKSSDIKSQFGCEILGVVPTATLACTMAQKSGEPIAQSLLDNNFVDQLTQITHKLCGMPTSIKVF